LPGSARREPPPQRHEVRGRWAIIERQVEEIATLASGATDAALDRARLLRDELRRELRKGKETPPPSA
jgi:hypothetical protein